MSEIKIMKPAEMMELAKQGGVIYKENVLQGPTLKGIIKNIESSAMEGYMGWSKKLTSTDDIRELKVIQEHLVDIGYQCEFKKEKIKTLLGELNITKFVICWNKK